MKFYAQLICWVCVGGSLVFCPGWPSTVILLIFTCQVSGIRGVSCWHRGILTT
jgi:hypothetical protein